MKIRVGIRPRVCRGLTVAQFIDIVAFIEAQQV
jgi:hypothetical protein